VFLHSLHAKPLRKVVLNMQHASLVPAYYTSEYEEHTVHVKFEMIFWLRIY